MSDKRTIMQLNDLIYKIHTITDYDQMRKSFLEELQFLIPAKIIGFYLASSISPYELDKPIVNGIPDEKGMRYLREYQNIDFTRWAYTSPSSRVFRDLDLMPESKRVNTPYYKFMYIPNGVHYSLMLTLIYNSKFLGCLTLFRDKESNDFSDEDVFLMDVLKDHLNYRTYISINPTCITSNATSTDIKIDSLDKNSLYEMYSLTHREIEIVYLLLSGNSKDDISGKLCISVNTVKSHILNVYRKLNINSLRELYIFGKNLK
ncbi:MAG: helix-turn-helix transcriptional regulator [Clostridiales bacterium]|nr:helix-turn-helix transcriptional regulator [Clostridiales bacterium]